MSDRRYATSDKRSAPLAGLFELLVSYRKAGVFNQYAESDPALDLAEGAAVRRANLRCYLETFAAARILLVGEAAGYAGCRFSGIPFTAEAQLVGPQPLSWTQGKGLARSSKAEQPWKERSACVVWDALGGRSDCLLWNAFPWHPFHPGQPLSNRHPRADLADGLPVLRYILALFPSARPCAVGRTAQKALAALGVAAPYIRHPSHGGKRAFEKGLSEVIPNEPTDLY